jgi:hypothetical protein
VLACSSGGDCGLGFACVSAQCVPLPEAPIDSAPTMGAPPRSPPSGPACDVTWDNVYEAVEADVLRQDAEVRSYLRYVSLANRLNAGQCGAQLDDDRALLSVLDSLATVTVRNAPTPIGGETETYRVDLRDYGLSSADGPLIVGDVSFVDAWEAIVRSTVYAVPFQGDQAENVQLLTGTTVPLLFLDSFVAGARGAALPRRDPAPIEAVVDTFSADVDLDTAAGDVLVPSDSMGNELARLDPLLAELGDGSRVDRDQWSALYVQTLCIMTVANENRPTTDVCIENGALP